MISDNELQYFVDYDFEKNCRSEEDVKIKFVVKLLEALGYKIEDMFFESNKKDIYIRNKRNNVDIVVEVKKYDYPNWCSSEVVNQLASYCKETKSSIAVLTNGKELRIYFPQWEERPNFRDRIVAWISHKHLQRKKHILNDLLAYDSLQEADIDEKKDKYKYHHIEKAEVLDYANYFGLIEEKQIMYCTRRQYSFSQILMCKDDKNSRKYKLSAEGEKFVADKQFKHSKYFAQIEIIKPKKLPLRVWQELYDQRCFYFWDPKKGPKEFFNKNRAANLALCRVYKTKVFIEKSDLGGGQTNRFLKNPSKFEKINLEKENWEPLISDETYQAERDKILDIISDYL